MLRPLVAAAASDLDCFMLSRWSDTDDAPYPFPLPRRDVLSCTAWELAQSIARLQHCYQSPPDIGVGGVYIDAVCAGSRDAIRIDLQSAALAELSDEAVVQGILDDQEFDPNRTASIGTIQGLISHAPTDRPAEDAPLPGIAPPPPALVLAGSAATAHPQPLPAASSDRGQLPAAIGDANAAALRRTRHHNPSGATPWLESRHPLCRAHLPSFVAQPSSVPLLPGSPAILGLPPVPECWT